MKWVLFFDGDCAFCTRWVNRVFDLDRRGVIDFSPLQGELARRHGLEKHADLNVGTMVVLREADGTVFLRGDAVLELARALGGWCRIGLLGRLIPGRVRDGIYQWIARNRHRFGGGKDDACRMPTVAFRQRMRP